MVSLGFILYTFGAKHLPSAELTFLTLLEIVGGVFGFGHHFLAKFLILMKLSSLLIILGGMIIILAIIYYKGYSFDKKVHYCL